MPDYTRVCCCAGVLNGAMMSSCVLGMSPTRSTALKAELQFRMKWSLACCLAQFSCIKLGGGPGGQIVMEGMCSKDLEGVDKVSLFRP